VPKDQSLNCHHPAYVRFHPVRDPDPEPLARDHKHLLGDRIAEGLYNFLEGLVAAHYEKDRRIGFST